MPSAPLRAMLLTTAGGGYLRLTEGASARPTNPIAQFGYDLASRNPFDNAVVLIDEVHNLIGGSKAAKEVPPQLRRLKAHLLTANNLTLAVAKVWSCSLQTGPTWMSIVCRSGLLLDEEWLCRRYRLELRQSSGCGGSN